TQEPEDKTNTCQGHGEEGECPRKPPEKGSMKEAVGPHRKRSSLAKNRKAFREPWNALDWIHLCPGPVWVGWAKSETKKSFWGRRRVRGVFFPRIEGLCPQCPHSSPIILSPSRTCNAHHSSGHLGKYSPGKVGAKYSRPIRAGQRSTKVLDERRPSAGRGHFLSRTRKVALLRAGQHLCEQRNDPKDVSRPHNFLGSVVSRFGCHCLHSACRRLPLVPGSRVRQKRLLSSRYLASVPGGVALLRNFSHSPGCGLAVRRDRAVAEPPGKRPCDAPATFVSDAEESEKCSRPWSPFLARPAVVSGPAAEFSVLESRRTLGSAALPFYKKRAWKEDCVDFWKLQSHVSGLSIPKPYVIALLEDGKEPWMVEKKLSKSLFPDWKSRWESKELSTKEDIYDEDFPQMVIMEKTIKQSHEFSNFNKDLDCIEKLEGKCENQVEHFRPVTLTFRESPTRESVYKCNMFRSILPLKSILSEPQRISDEGKSHKHDIFKKSLPANSVIKNETINDGKKLLNSNERTDWVINKGTSAGHRYGTLKSGSHLQELLLQAPSFYCKGCWPDDLDQGEKADKQRELGW
ncbi:hypothetical protein E2I00_005446, partial [Balaenoptera physalus]